MSERNIEIDIERKVKDSFSKITPDILDSILMDCERKEQVAEVKESVKKNNRAWLRTVIACAAAFILIFGGTLGINTYKENNTVSARISLDVNPSVEIQVNRKERVLDVIPLNEDGQKIIGDMDFSGSTIDVAVNALVASMMRNGYISDMANSILVTVSGEDAGRDTELESRVTAEIGKILAGNSMSESVISQVLKSDEVLNDLAEEYGITEGKAKLINEIVSQNSIYKFEDMVPLTINQLKLLTESNDIKLSDMTSTGTASDTAYIGNQKAEEIALSHASVTSDNAIDLHSKLEWEHGKMIYDVEFDSEGYEYDYDIDALTGDILKYEKEIDDDYVKAQAIQNSNNQGNSEVPAQNAPQSSPVESAPNQNTASQNTSGQPTPDNTTPEVNAPVESTPSQSLISVSTAQSKALSYAGLSASAVSDLHTELDYDDGRPIYEVEFKSAGYEYDVDVDAYTGEILDFDKEIDD